MMTTARLLPCFIAALVGLAASLCAEEPTPTLEERVTAAARDHRHPLAFDGEAFSGPAWRFLLEEGRDAQFFLIGEQHGIAENARLSAAIFEELVPAGYRTLAIEISPPMAVELDRALQSDGLDGLVELYALPGGKPAFFGLKEEAEFLAAARASVRGPEPMFWGLDYEVASDRHLLRLLESKPKPPEAETELRALAAASEASWHRYTETRKPQFIFSFAGDPALIDPIRQAWPARDPQTSQILDTLEATLEINRLWSSGQGWKSNEKRAGWLRANFLRRWRAEKAAGRAPRVLFKFGASHLVRGRSTTEVFDLGALLPEVAALEGRSTFSVLVLAGLEAATAVFDPVTWTHQPARPRDRYAAGLDPILAAAFDEEFTLIDLRPLRSLLTSSARSKVSHELMRTVHGYDALLLMTGSTPARDLE